LKINYLLERDRLADYAATMSEDNRIKVRHQLQAQRDNLESQLGATLRALYGIAQADESAVGASVGEDGHVLSLLPGHRPTLAGGAGFEYNALALADGLFDALYPKHPNFDTAGNRKAVTLGELRTVLDWITRAMEDGRRRVVVDRAQLALVKRIVHPLELGEVTDGPLNVGSEWRRRIEQAATQHGVTGDYGVEDIRGWITELGYTGLDKPVANLIIAGYALLADRAWVLHGSPLPQPPDLDRIGPGHALRAQELPGAEEFAAARHRAGALFGVHVPDMLFARNVNRLASEVGQRVAAFEGPVNDLRRSLDRHSADLGLTPDSSRVTGVRQAAELLARLSGARDATSVTRELAATGTSAAVTDEVLAATITAAPTVLAALDRVEWSLLESVRGFTGRGDGLAERAERLIDEVTRAATEDEFVRQLAPVLDGVRQRAVALISEAARLATVAPPAAVPTSPVPTPQPGSAAPVRVTESMAAPVVESYRPASPLRRRFRVSGAERELAKQVEAVVAEIRGYADAHRGEEIEVFWRVVGEDIS